MEEFRRALDRMIKHPHAWQPLDETYRRCRLHRFPYGIVYRIDAAADEILIVAIMHLNDRPGRVARERPLICPTHSIKRRSRRLPASPRVCRPYGARRMDSFDPRLTPWATV